ncbi:putative prostaglandin g h synthase 2 cyclooxygenase pgh2 cox2 [Diplodia seriata]|uniref:linoleate 8R-lipoxygenase n=1 Tax=Diplodia seriata TaxID=420778 RepID=A0A0G2FU59_9PEZI|nr:putative prostaglandin g h synthase 2 cyclooxygenase pgh2 cox2 [Diplodia seriata]
MAEPCNGGAAILPAKGLGPLAFLIPLLGLLAVAVFTKFVRKRPLSSLVPNLKSFNPKSLLDPKNLHLPKLSLPKSFPSLPKLPFSLPKPHFSLPNAKLPTSPVKSPLAGLANLPNGKLLSSHLPKGHFLSGKVPKSLLPELPWYLKFLSPTGLVKNLVFKVFNLHKVPGLRDIVSWFMKPKGFVPKGTLATLSSLRSIRPGLLSKLNPFNLKIFNKKALASQADDEKFQAGEPYGDPDVVSSNLVEDLRTVGFSAATKDLKTLIEVFKAKGKPQNDREMLMEKMIALTASLPRHSKTRDKLSGVIIDTLWSSLQHPPLTYMGEKFQYRTPDGSYNNPMNPDLGKAGSHYARSVPRIKSQHGVPPDPGLLFDLLMARSDETFKENPAGISSMLFYHATIIIHDIFRTNRFDNNISDTSSYLDLAPLYGSSLEDQLKIRTMEKGLLKPDTFHERRLIGQPPGVNVILVMYNRFHNYVADVLLKINEGGRFTLVPGETDEEKAAAIAKQDNDLFQTARLIVGGLYINISLHDYLRGLTNCHHSATDWTLDPRIAASRLFDPDGIPRGVGNQVSAEFNLLYRFHSIISKKDETWLNEFLSSLFPGSSKPLDELTPQEFVQGLFAFEQTIPADPSKREFGNLKRGPDGRFADADLEREMTAAMEDPAGLFGPRMVPKFLKIVEITGILTARKWQLGSLNELRDFFKLKRHDTFEDVNPDPAVADLLRKLYDHPDMVEMYPGMFLEDAKPRMDPGCGGCPPYTVGRAVFSDAVTLVRSDRFCTLDYTAGNLTNWGFNEVAADYDVLGGSKFYHLFQRALPGWYPFNSLHIMQPMFTRQMNEQIATELGTIADYTTKGPAPPKKPILLVKHSTITKMLEDQANFHIPWVAYEGLFPGKKSFAGFMLGGDSPANTAQKKLVKDVLYTPAEFGRLLADTAVAYGRKLIKRECLELKKDLAQLDIIRDVAIPLNTKLIADLWCQDLQTDENPTGTLSTPQLYKYLMDVRTFGFNNNDPAMTWRRRLWAREAAEVLIPSTIKAIKEGTASLASPGGLLKRAGAGVAKGLGKVPLLGKLVPQAKEEGGSLRWYGHNVAREIMAAGRTLEETADICWLTALAGVGAPVSMFADVLSFFLRPENVHHWEQIQNLATSGADRTATDKTLRQYVLEAERMVSNLRGARVCVGATEIDGQKFAPGDAVVCLFGPACRKEGGLVPEPESFQLDRPASAYIHWGAGPHECLGKEIAIGIVVSLVKVCAELKCLRPAPGDMGELKSIMVGTERCYLNDSWSWLTFDPTTWKVHFDGYGKGVYRESAAAAAKGRDLKALYSTLVKQNSKGPKGVTPGGLLPPTQAAAAPNGVTNGYKEEEPVAAKPKPNKPAPAATNGASNGEEEEGEGGAVQPPAANGASKPAQQPDGWSFDGIDNNNDNNNDDGGGAVKPPAAVEVDGKDSNPAPPAEEQTEPEKPKEEEDPPPPPPADPDVLQTGRLAKKADSSDEGGLGSYTASVTFDKPYSTPPRIFLGFATLDIGATAAQSPNFHQEARDVTTAGFTLAVAVAPSSAPLRQLDSVWLVVPTDAAHRDVLVGVWDTSKTPGKPVGSGGTAVDSAFIPLRCADGEPPAPGRRAVVPWLAGFALDTAPAEPFGVKVDARSATNDAGEPGAIVSFRTPSSLVPRLPTSVRVNFLVFPPNGALGLSPASARAEFPNVDTDSITVLATANKPIRSVVGIDMFQYVEDAEAICLRVVDRQKEPDEAKYSLESWGEPLVHDLSAGIVKIPKTD